MISLPILIDVFVGHPDSGNLLNERERLKDRNGIVAPATDVIDRRRTRALNELIHELDNIIGVDVVAYLFPKVPENLVGFPFQVAPDQVA